MHCFDIDYNDDESQQCIVLILTMPIIKAIQNLIFAESESVYYLLQSQKTISNQTKQDKDVLTNYAKR